MRSGRFAPLLAFLAAFFIYFLTLAPTITFKHDGADSGDLATAAFTLGIPHPPGYPLFTLLASLFAHLPGVEAARGVGVMVALFGALAVFILSRAGSALIVDFPSGPLRVWVPFLGALAFAFSPALWSQATLVEVYTLALVLVTVVLWAMVSNHPARIPIAAAAFGLGLAHHLSIVLLLPGAWLALAPTRRDWRAGLLLLAPLLLYAYLPLRALAHPPVNWGNPATLEGFFWDLSAAPYRGYLLNESAADALARVQYMARLLFDQFTPVGIALALWGLVSLVQERKRLALALGLTAALVAVYATLYVSRDSFIYLLFAYPIVLLWLVYGVADLVTRVRVSVAQVILVGLLMLVAVYNLVADYAAMDLSGDQSAIEYAARIIDRTPATAVIFADGDDAFFSLTYYRYVRVPDRARIVLVSQGLLQYDWYDQEVRYRMGSETFRPVAPAQDAHGRAIAIVEAAVATNRAVCFDSSSPLLPEYTYTRSGGVNCVASRR